MPTLQLFSVVTTLPTVKVKISGVEHYLIIDTGAEHSLLSPEVVGVFNGSAREVECHGVGGDRPGFIIPKKIRLFGKELNGFIISDNFVSLRRTFGVRVSALIGQDLLRQFSQVIFDNRNKTVRFVE